MALPPLRRPCYNLPRLYRIHHVPRGKEASMHADGWLTRRRAFGLLLGLVLAAAGLCLRWVFIVPIYQSPDEPAHLDYALAIYHNGGLFRVHGPPTRPLELVHP